MDTELCHHFQSVALSPCFFPDAGTISVESWHPLVLVMCAALGGSYKVESRYLPPLCRGLLLLLGFVLPHQQRRRCVLVRRSLGPCRLLLWLLRSWGEKAGDGRLCASGVLATSQFIRAKRVTHRARTRCAALKPALQGRRGNWSVGGPFGRHGWKKAEDWNQWMASGS